MANHCYNFISLNGDNKSIKELAKRLTDTYDKFHYLNGWCDYVLKIRDDFNYIKEEDKRDYHHYGSKWFDFDVYVDDNCITIQGASAWSPMVKFTEDLCEVYNLSGSIEYEESGCDFGGYAVYIGEEEVDSGEFTYMEWKYRSDLTYWMEDMIEYLIELDDDELFLEIGEASIYASKEHISMLEEQLSKLKTESNINL